MRLILTGIAGFAFGLALPSEGRHAIGPADAELWADSLRLSVFGMIHPKRFDLPAPLGLQISDRSRVRVASLGTDVTFAPAVEETDRRSDPPVSMRQRMSFDERFSFDGRFSFDERFRFDQPSDSFDQRFVAAAVSPAGAPAMTAETEEGTGSILRIARLPSPDPGQRAMAHPAIAPRLASLASPPPASSAKKIRLATLETPTSETPKGSSLSLDPDSRTAIYDITARTVYMPDGRRLEAHSGFGDRMDDPRYVNVKREGPTPPNVYDLSLRENLFHGVRALRMTPVGDGKMYGRGGILAHSYLLGPSGQSNGCVSFSDYPAFLNAFLRGEVTRLVVVERLASPPTTQVASASFLKSLMDLFSRPERTAPSQPERAAGYAAVSN
jgi:Tlde1 domain